MKEDNLYLRTHKVKHTSNNRCTNGGASDVLGDCGNAIGLFVDTPANKEGGVLLFVFSSEIFSIAFKNALGS